MKCLFTLLFSFVFVKSYSQNNLIGTWRRISPYVKHVTMDSSQVQIGDLTLYPDSTFFMQGDSATSGDTVPGWHVGDEHRGIWFQPDKNHLVLRQQNILYLNYEIIGLTNEKLVLRNRMDEISHKRFYLTYKRIKYKPVKPIDISMNERLKADQRNLIPMYGEEIKSSEEKLWQNVILN